MLNIEIEIDGLNFNDHGINCALVPIYLATKAFGKEYPQIFYLYFYFTYHYNLLGLELTDLFDNFYSKKDIITNFILNNKLGLGLKDVEANNENLITKIVEGIDQKNPVIVPINSGEVYYYGNYNERDHGHLLLVKGYDEKKELLIIHDVGQLGRFLFRDTNLGRELGSVYSTFCMKYEDCKKHFKSYNEIYTYKKNVLQYLFPLGEQNAVETFMQALNDISEQIKLYSGNFDSLLSCKFQLINGKISNDSNDTRLMNFNNSYFIISKMLSNYVEKNQDKNTLKIRTMADQANKTYEAWKNYLVQAMVKRKRKDFELGQLNELRERVVNEELKFLNCVALFQVES